MTLGILLTVIVLAVIFTMLLSVQDKEVEETASYVPLSSKDCRLSKVKYEEVCLCSIFLYQLLKDISNNKDIFDDINETSTNSGGSKMTDHEYFFFVIKSIFVQDLKRCFEEMGHTPIFSARYKEDQCLALILGIINGIDGFSHYNTFTEGMAKSDGSVIKQAGKLYYSLLNSGVSFSVQGDDEFGLSALLITNGADEEVEKYHIYLYRLITAITKIDDIVTPKEQAWLDKMLVINGKQSDSNQQHSTIVETKENSGERDKREKVMAMQTSYEELEKELGKLIGLQKVKEEVQSLSNFITISQKRKEMGLSVPEVSYHLVFTGNPGTGKTTVARILAGIFRDKGILQKGHLVETDRSGLVAEYVGQTAVKTNKIIDKALDGVLFIDEAYSLIAQGEDFGQEAVATLLKRMEDDRDRLIVILAGYTKEMETFINSNPGLRSRFNRYIFFPDYSAEELSEIFFSIAKKQEYTMKEEVKQYVRDRLQDVVNDKPKDFGNARYVRNLFERVVQTQANRLAKESSLSKNMLTEIIIEDITMSCRTVN